MEFVVSNLLVSFTFEVESFSGEMYWVSHLNWEAVVVVRKLQIGLIIDNPKREYGKNQKVNWTKEEEYTLIDGILAAGDELRGTGQSEDINKKMRLWNDVLKNINSIHVNCVWKTWRYCYQRPEGSRKQSQWSDYINGNIKLTHVWIVQNEFE